MRVALDYDGTVTESFDLWAAFVSLFKQGGHDVRIVTFRGPDHLTNDLADFAEYAGIPIIFTSATHKKPYCHAIGWDPDIWIDDTPSLIGDDEEVWAADKKEEWKQSINENLSDREPEEFQYSFDLQPTTDSDGA